MMLLVIKDLTKTYSRQQKTFEAVSHVGFSLQKGEMAVITGPSGCGKSTLFHLICGITRPDQGSIQLEKQELVGLSNKELAKVRAQKISYILQGNSLLPNFTVLENICLPYQLGGWQEDLKEKAMELLKEFGLENMAQEYPDNLSGGERRRVAIARAFVHDPILVVADEPTSDLDVENTEIILDYFQRQQQKDPDQHPRPELPAPRCHPLHHGKRRPAVSGRALLKKQQTRQRCSLPGLSI